MRISHAQVRRECANGCTTHQLLGDECLMQRSFRGTVLSGPRRAQSHGLVSFTGPFRRAAVSWNGRDMSTRPTWVPDDAYFADGEWWRRDESDELVLLVEPPSLVPLKVGDRISMKVEPLTWWDRFLWRWFRIVRKHPSVRRDFIITDAVSSKDSKD